MGRAARDLGDTYFIRPDDNGGPAEALSPARFKQATVIAIDRHARAIADLSAQLTVTREFMADVAARLDQVAAQLAELKTILADRGTLLASEITKGD